ncbi:hypothetical protein BJX96DRAFT_149535 [Aspergillus floccosus]
MANFYWCLHQVYGHTLLSPESIIACRTFGRVWLWFTFCCCYLELKFTHSQAHVLWNYPALLLRCHLHVLFTVIFFDPQLISTIITL